MLLFACYLLVNIEYPEVPEFTPRPKTIEEKIRLAFPEEPNNMLAIVNCESGFNQSAVSHTRDFGLFQINEKTWDATAQEMGLDYKGSLDDNITMARYVYDIQGINAWVCWTKYISPELAIMI